LIKTDTVIHLQADCNDENHERNLQRSHSRKKNPRLGTSLEPQPGSRGNLGEKMIKMILSGSFSEFKDFCNTLPSVTSTVRYIQSTDPVHWMNPDTHELIVYGMYQERNDFLEIKKLLEERGFEVTK
jgi:hypothetical protein